MSGFAWLLSPPKSRTSRWVSRVSSFICAFRSLHGRSLLLEYHLHMARLPASVMLLLSTSSMPLAQRYPEMSIFIVALGSTCKTPELPQHEDVLLLQHSSAPD